MSKGTLYWLTIFFISASLFFVIATVVAVKGAGDLRKLLRGSKD